MRLFHDPFINGLVTLAVALFAVYTSYTANNGLPFAPSYHVKVDVPDAGQLVRHAEVRVGGARVGQVLKIRAIPGTAGKAPYAQLELALKSSLKGLKADTHSEVRVASILGGKYLSLVPGHGGASVPENGVLPLSQAATAVDLDEAFRVFDPPTRKSLAASITELGNAFAGRGVESNNAFAALAAASIGLQRVLTVIADPATNLSGFISSAAAATQTLTPLTPQVVSVLENGATTLRAVNAAGDALGRSVDALPGSVAQTTTTLTHLRPALASAAAIGRDLEPTAKLIPRTFANLDATLLAAAPVAVEARALGTPLKSAFRAVNRFAANRNAINALHVLGGNDLATFGASGFVGLGALLAAVAPAQISCNVAGLWTHNLASTVSDGDANGPWVRLLPVIDAQQMLHAATPAGNLHLNAYPNESAQECEAGNEPYGGGGRVIGNPAGNQSTTVTLTKPPAAATRRARAAGLLTRSGR
jgi:virulence factor Mce-like protein